MLTLSTIFLFLHAYPISLAFARGLPRRDPRCLTQEDAQQVADNYQSLMKGYNNRLADASLSAKFR